MSRLTLIVAATKSNGIGQNSRLPWHLPKEMAYFARVTSAVPNGKMNSVVMGRKTWESIPRKFRPLKERVNVIISRNEEYNLFPWTEVTSTASTTPAYLNQNLESAISRLSTLPTPIYRNFVIGGASIYGDALALTPTAKNYVDRILLTRIIAPEFKECDVFIQNFIEEHGDRWKRAEYWELREWAGFEVPEGEQEENGVRYEFQMWVR